MTCKHRWGERETYVTALYCHDCDKSSDEVDGEALAAAWRAIENVAMLAKRLRKTDPENAEHFLRFCREAGWEDSILRGDSE
jgi:hypothetical protein